MYRVQIQIGGKGELSFYGISRVKLVHYSPRSSADVFPTNNTGARVKRPLLLHFESRAAIVKFVSSAPFAQQLTAASNRTRRDAHVLITATGIEPGWHFASRVARSEFLHFTQPGDWTGIFAVGRENLDRFDNSSSRKRNLKIYREANEIGMKFGSTNKRWGSIERFFPSIWDAYRSCR